MATRKIGATIALDGAANFKKDVNSCDQALKGFQAELGKTKAEYDGQQNSLEALTKKHSVLEKTLDAAKKKQEAVGKALEASRKAQDNAAKAVEKQQDAVDKAQKELEDYRKSTDKTAEGEKALEKALAEAQVELDKANKGYDKAEKSVYNWTTQSHKADTEVINLNNALRDNDKYLDEAQRSADGTAKSIDEYGRKAKSAADSTGETVTALGKLEAAKSVATVMSNLAQKMGQLADAAINTAKSLDDGYDTIITKTGATGDALERLAGIANDIYGRMPGEMSEIGSAIGEINTRFGIQGEELEALAEKFLKFARINGTNVSTSVDKVQKALTAFGRPASDAADLLDAMTKAGQDTGVGMDQLSDALLNNATVLQEMGLSLEDSVKFVGQLEKSGVDSSTAMSGLSKALKNATEDGKDINTALSDLEDTILNGTEDMDGLTASYELFGKKGDGIYNAVKNGSLSFKDLSGNVSDFAGTVDRTFDATQDAWDDWSVATNNLKLALNDLTTEGLETLQPAIDKTVELAQEFNKWVKQLPTPIRKVVSVTALLTGQVGKAIPQVVSFTSQLAQLKIASQMSGGAIGGSGGLTSAISGFIGTTAGVAAITLGAAAGIGAIAGAVINATGVLDGLDSRIGDVAGAANDMSEVLGTASSNLQTTMEEASKTVEATETTAGVASGLIDELEELANKSSRTAEENARMSQIVGELNAKFPDLALEIDKTTGELNLSTQAIRDFVEEAKKTALIEVYNEKIAESYSAVYDAQAAVYEGNLKLEEIEKTQKEIQGEIDATTDAMTENRKEAQRLQKQLTNETYSNDLINRINDLDAEYEQLNQTLTDQENELKDVNGFYNDAKGDVDGLKQKVTEAETEIDKWNAVLEENKGALEESKKKTEEAAGAADALESATRTEIQAFADLTPASQDMAVAVAQAVGDMQSAVESSIQSQINWFDKAAEVQQIDSQTIIDNMASQVQAVSNWESNLATLSSMVDADGNAINQNLLQHLIDLGPAGAAQVQAFVNMSADELAEANRLWGEAMDLQGLNTEIGDQLTEGIGKIAAGGDEAFAQLGAEWAELTGQTGEMTVAGLVDGINKAAEQATTAAETLGEDVIEKLNAATGVASPSRFTAETGRNIDQGLVNGLSNSGMRDFIRRAAQLVAADANVAAYAGPYISAAQLAGLQIAQAFASGISMGRGYVAIAMSGLTGGAPTQPTRPVNGSGNINSTINMTINGSNGQNVNELANIVSQKINRQINSLRSARG